MKNTNLAVEMMKKIKSPHILKFALGEWSGDDGERGHHFPVKPLDPKRWFVLEVGV